MEARMRGFNIFRAIVIGCMVISSLAVLSFAPTCFAVSCDAEPQNVLAAYLGEWGDTQHMTIPLLALLAAALSFVLYYVFFGAYTAYKMRFRWYADRSRRHGFVRGEVARALADGIIRIQ